jgi:RNA polymerase sigma-70 factor, ECF subfamily
MVRHSASGPPPAGEQRLRQLVREHFALVWRTLRRLGVAEADLQDAAQSVFVVVGEKLHSITTDREQSFVFGTALRVASHTRRSRRRKREASLEEAGVLWDGAPTPEEALERTQALDRLAAILNGMDEQLRSVFVLFELEQLTMIEIARLEQLPLGTVASRLRRARQYFKNATTRGEAEGVA